MRFKTDMSQRTLENTSTDETLTTYSMDSACNTDASTVTAATSSDPAPKPETTADKASVSSLSAEIASLKAILLEFVRKDAESKAALVRDITGLREEIGGLSEILLDEKHSRSPRNFQMSKEELASVLNVDGSPSSAPSAHLISARPIVSAPDSPASTNGLESLNTEDAYEAPNQAKSAAGDRIIEDKLPQILRRESPTAPVRHFPALRRPQDDPAFSLRFKETVQCFIYDGTRHGENSPTPEEESVPLPPVRLIPSPQESSQVLVETSELASPILIHSPEAFNSYSPPDDQNHSVFPEDETPELETHDFIGEAPFSGRRLPDVSESCPASIRRAYEPRYPEEEVQGFGVCAVMKSTYPSMSGRSEDPHSPHGETSDVDAVSDGNASSVTSDLPSLRAVREPEDTECQGSSWEFIKALQEINNKHAREKEGHGKSIEEASSVKHQPPSESTKALSDIIDVAAVPWQTPLPLDGIAQTLLASPLQTAPPYIPTYEALPQRTPSPSQDPPLHPYIGPGSPASEDRSWLASPRSDGIHDIANDQSAPQMRATISPSNSLGLSDESDSDIQQTPATITAIDPRLTQLTSDRSTSVNRTCSHGSLTPLPAFSERSLSLEDSNASLLPPRLSVSRTPSPRLWNSTAGPRSSAQLLRQTLPDQSSRTSFAMGPSFGPDTTRYYPTPALSRKPVAPKEVSFESASAGPYRDEKRPQRADTRVPSRMGPGNRYQRLRSTRSLTSASGSMGQVSSSFGRSHQRAVDYYSSSDTDEDKASHRSSRSASMFAPFSQGPPAPYGYRHPYLYHPGFSYQTASNGFPSAPSGPYQVSRVTHEMPNPPFSRPSPLQSTPGMSSSYYAPHDWMRFDRLPNESRPIGMVAPQWRRQEQPSLRPFLPTRARRGTVSSTGTASSTYGSGPSPTRRSAWQEVPSPVTSLVRGGPSLAST